MVPSIGRRALLAALVVVLVFALALPALAQQNGVIVNAAILNVRSGPGVGFGVVSRVNGGANVVVLGSNADGSWVQVQLAGGISGWVNARYVSVTGGAPSVPVTAPITTNSAVVTASFLNVRSGPSAGFGDVGTLRQGDVVTLIGRIGTNSWVQIQFGSGQTGWISTRYISSNVPISFLPITGDAGGVPVQPPPPNASPTGIVTTGQLNVRFGPGTGFGVVTTVRSGQSVSLLGRNGAGNWVQVQVIGGAIGWINANYITPTVPISSLPITTNF